MRTALLTNLLILMLGMIAAAGLIYLTPLKNINIIDPVIKDIDAKEFHDAYIKDPSKYIFIDVRPLDVYNKFHAEGATSMPLHTLYDERLNLPKSGKEIVLICSGGRASGVGYMYLEHYGFTNIHRIHGGIETWYGEGLPIVGDSSSLLSGN